MRAEVARFGASLAHFESLRGREAVVQAEGNADGLEDAGREGSSGKDMDVDAEQGDAEGNGETLPAATPQAAAGPRVSTANRWAALRGFITATMEQNPAFTTKS